MSVDRKQFLQLVLSGGLGALFGGGSPVPERWTERGITLTTINRQSLVMGSLISFEVIAESESEGYEAIRRAEQIFRSLEKIFSMYDNQSEMAKLAQQAGKEPIAVSQDAIELLQFAKKLHRHSSGRFDITIEPAMQRWGFRQNPGQTVERPTEQEVQRLEQIIGSEKIIIEDGNVLLNESGMAIDTGGIAGGYALDSAIRAMKKSDVAAGFINFSGDIHCFGEPLEDKKWPVHILDPKTQQPLREPIMLSNEALSTSGAYQKRRHDSAKQSWGHLLLPDQAKPIEPVGSVTAIHPSAMTADAWSTAVYVGTEAPADVQTVTLTKN